MQHIRRSAISASYKHNNWINILKPQNGFRSFMEYKPEKCFSNMGFASKANNQIVSNTGLHDIAKRVFSKSNSVRQSISNANHVARGIGGANGKSILFRGQHMRECIASAPFHKNIARSFSSKASQQQGKEASQTRKDISTTEDPFDPLTDKIPEKPVTFAEGASYSVVILAGLGIAAAAAYAVFKELIFQPKEYKIFGKALERVQNDSQVRVRIGSPITGYGQESRNRAARQRIPHRIRTDEDGVEHIEVNFFIRGPHGAGKVYCEMFKDKVDNQWKYTSLLVEIVSPSRTQLILESYIPTTA